MLYPNESPFAVSIEPRIDLYEVEREVERFFTEMLGEGTVVGIEANEYPGRIGVTLFLESCDEQTVSAISERVKSAFAVQGVRVGILALPVSAMKRGTRIASL